MIRFRCTSLFNNTIRHINRTHNTNAAAVTINASAHSRSFTPLNFQSTTRSNGIIHRFSKHYTSRYLSTGSNPVNSINSNSNTSNQQQPIESNTLNTINDSQSASASTATNTVNSPADADLSSTTESSAHSIPLTVTQRHLLNRIKFLFDRLRRDLTSFSLSERDSALLRRSQQRAEELFLFVVVGEYNAGKSSFINSLLGRNNVCETGVLPTTSSIHIIRYGSNEFTEIETENDELINIGSNTGSKTVSTYLPLPFLRLTNICDTPGVNAVLTHHAELTENYIPAADSIIFITSVDRPLSESERQFLLRIQQWKKKVIIVLNKVDLVPNPADRQKIIQFIQSHINADNTTTSTGSDSIRIFPVSASLAMQGKLSNNPSMIQQSGLADLELYLHSLLVDRTRIALKLGNQLGIAEKILAKYYSIFQTRKQQFESDSSLLTQVESEMSEFESSSQSDLTFQRSSIDNLYLKLLNSATEFIDNNIKFSAISTLIRSHNPIQHQYLNLVYRTFQSDLRDTLNQLFDWLSAKSNRTFNSIYSNLQRRNPQFVQSTSANQFLNLNNQSQQLFNSIQAQLNTIITNEHLNEQANMIKSQSRTDALITVFCILSALGLITVLVTETLQFSDYYYSAPIAAGTLILIGLYRIPASRRRLNRLIRSQIESQHRSTAELVNNQYSNQLNLIQKQLNQTLNTLQRHLSSESTLIQQGASQFEQLQHEIQAIQKQIRQIQNNSTELGSQSSTNTSRA